MRPERLRLSREAGFNLQALSKEVNGLPAVNVARPSAFGNPYVVGAPVDRKQVKRWGWQFRNFDYVATDNMDAVKRFRGCLVFDEAIHAFVIQELRGKNLACWCGPDEDCHADVLLWFANRPQCQEVHS